MIPHIIRFILELVWRDWQHVGTFEEILKYKDGSGYYATEHTCKTYIHCFESRWGTRRAKITFGAFYPNALFLRGKVRRLSLYQKTIYPWLHNRINSEIPAFKKVRSGRWDFIKGLKGETPAVLNDDESTK